MSIKKESIDRWFEIEEKLAKLKQEKDNLAKAFKKELSASGKNAITRHGAILAFKPGDIRVSWKDAFMDECGVEKANELIRAAKPCRSFSVTKKDSDEPSKEDQDADA